MRKFKSRKKTKQTTDHYTSTRLPIVMVPTTRTLSLKAWYLALVHLPFFFCEMHAQRACSSWLYCCRVCLDWNRNSRSHLPSTTRGPRGTFVCHNSQTIIPSVFWLTFADSMDQKAKDLSSFSLDPSHPMQQDTKARNRSIKGRSWRIIHNKYWHHN
jgi:hypothetical protein